MSSKVHRRTSTGTEAVEVEAPLEAVIRWVHCKFDFTLTNVLEPKGSGYATHCVNAGSGFGGRAARGQA